MAEGEFPPSTPRIRIQPHFYSKRMIRDPSGVNVPFASEHRVQGNNVDHLGMIQPKPDHVMEAHARWKKDVATYKQQFGTTEATGPVSKPAKKSKGIFGGLKDIVFGSDGTEKEVFRMLMLGKTGSGKSTTGNTILGENKFASGINFSSVTGVCDLQTVEKGGRIIELMDCPGLYDTNLSEQEIATTIVQAVACMHPGPHAILYIIRLGRYTADEFAVYNRLKALFDDGITKYMIVLFTGGDDLEREKKTLAELLKIAPKELIQVIDECEHRCHVFNNTVKNKRQVERLLDEVKTMKTASGSYNCPKYDSVGQDLENEVERRLARVPQQQEQYIRDLETKLNQMTKVVQNMHAEIEKKDREMKTRKDAQEEHLPQETNLSDLDKRLKELMFQLNLEEQRKEMFRMQRGIDEERKRVQQKEREREELEKQTRGQQEEENRQRERVYLEEMNRMKQTIAKHTEPSWVKKTAIKVASAAAKGARVVSKFFFGF